MDRARGHDEETLVVEADTRWEARSRRIMRTSMRVMGRVVRTYDADSGEEIVLPPPADFAPAASSSTVSQAPTRGSRAAMRGTGSPCPTSRWWRPGASLTTTPINPRDSTDSRRPHTTRLAMSSGSTTHRRRSGTSTARSTSKVGLFTRWAHSTGPGKKQENRQSSRVPGGRYDSSTGSPPPSAAAAWAVPSASDSLARCPNRAGFREGRPTEE